MRLAPKAGRALMNATGGCTVARAFAWGSASATKRLPTVRIRIASAWVSVHPGCVTPNATSWIRLVRSITVAPPLGGSALSAFPCSGSDRDLPARVVTASRTVRPGLRATATPSRTYHQARLSILRRASPDAPPTSSAAPSSVSCPMAPARNPGPSVLSSQRTRRRYPASVLIPESACFRRSLPRSERGSHGSHLREPR